MAADNVTLHQCAVRKRAEERGRARLTSRRWLRCFEMSPLNYLPSVRSSIRTSQLCLMSSRKSIKHKKISIAYPSSRASHEPTGPTTTWPARSFRCHPERRCCVLLIWLRSSPTCRQTMIYIQTHCIILSRTISTSNLAYSHLDIYHGRIERNIIIDQVD